MWPAEATTSKGMSPKTECMGGTRDSRATTYVTGEEARSIILVMRVTREYAQATIAAKATTDKDAWREWRQNVQELA